MSESADYMGPFDIRRFGAKCDGTNDAEAFRLAVAAATAAGGGVVYLPDGTYIDNTGTGEEGKA